MFKQIIKSTILTSCLTTQFTWACEAFITEVHANPKASSDQAAEFVELYLSQQNLPCEIVLTLDQDTLAQFELHSFNSPVVILDHPSLLLRRTLPNSPSLALQLYANGLTQDSTEVPPSLEGSSWERETGSDLTLGSFRPHSQHGPGEDSRAMMNPHFQHHFPNCGWVDRMLQCHNQSQAEVEVYSSGHELNWSLDSLIVIADGSNITPTLQNTRWHIKEDLYPLDDIYTWLPQVSFQISQLSPRSSDSTTEWFLFHNPDHIQGLSLIKGEDHYPLEDSLKIQTSDFCIYAQDLGLFQEEYGSLRMCQLELQPWPTLKNSGDTLCISLNGEHIDSSCIHWNQTDSIWIHPKLNDSHNNFLLMNSFLTQADQGPSIQLSNLYWQDDSPPHFNLINMKTHQEIQLKLFDLQGRPHLDKTLTSIEFIESFTQLIPFGSKQHYLLDLKLDSLQFQYKIYVE